MGAFNELAWASLQFPAKIAEEISGPHEWRYVLRMRHNPTLPQGRRAAEVALAHPDTLNLDYLLRLGNRTILDAVLDSDDVRDSTVRTVMDTWTLNAIDQMKLVSRGLSKHMASEIFQTTSLEFCNTAKYEASARSGLMFSHSHSKPGDPPPFAGRTATKVIDYSRKDGIITHWRSLEMTLEYLGDLRSLEPISNVVVAALGESASAWLAFLRLSDNDCDATLREVLEVTRNLVLT